MGLHKAGLIIAITVLVLIILYIIGMVAIILYADIAMSVQIIIAMVLYWTLMAALYCMLIYAIKKRRPDLILIFVIDVLLIIVLNTIQELVSYAYFFLSVPSNAILVGLSVFYYELYEEMKSEDKE